MMLLTRCSPPTMEQNGQRCGVTAAYSTNQPSYCNNPVDVCGPCYRMRAALSHHQNRPNEYYTPCETNRPTESPRKAWAHSQANGHYICKNGT